MVIKSEKTNWGREQCEKWLLIQGVPKLLEHFEFYFEWIEMSVLNLHQTCFIILYVFVGDEYVFPTFWKCVMGINSCYNIINSFNCFHKLYGQHQNSYLSVPYTWSCQWLIFNSGLTGSSLQRWFRWRFKINSLNT